MKKCIKTFIAFALLLMIVRSPILAQEDKGKPLLQLGVSANAYRGDLSSYDKWTIGFHGGLLLNKKKRLNGSFQFAFGKWTGQTNDVDYPGDPTKTPNTYFKTNFIAVNYELHFNIIKSDLMKLYIAQGIGIVHYTPKDEFGEKLRDLDNTRAEGESYGSISFMLPTKLGYIYFLPNRMGLGIETGFYNTLTDYLDNVSDWGTRSGKDNVLYVKFSISVPVNI